MYAETDGLELNDILEKENELEEIDYWILSRYNSVLKTYFIDMDKFEYTKVIRDLTEFLIEDISNWYIRRNRRRFWQKRFK